MSENRSSTTVPSPCNAICKFAYNVCIGCGRTSHEIEQWLSMTDSEKLLTVEKAGVRLGALSTTQIHNQVNQGRQQ